MEREVDARGLLCPWPVLRLTRAVREHGTGAYLLRADDPAASGEVAALCKERGWTLSTGPEPAVLRIVTG